jgi:putative transposase
LAKIKIAHKNLSRKKRGSNNRNRAKQRLNSLYEKVDDQRNDFLQKLSTKIVSENKLICIEKLDVKKMSKKNKRWNKRNMLDCSWATFASMLKRKAESAGAKVIEVNPKNTTKKCSQCGSIQSIPITQRTYHCDCGLELDRDTNAAKNILALGQSFAEANPLQADSSLQELSMKQEAITSTPKVLGYE